MSVNSISIETSFVLSRARSITFEHRLNVARQPVSYSCSSVLFLINPFADHVCTTLQIKFLYKFVSSRHCCDKNKIRRKVVIPE